MRQFKVGDKIIYPNQGLGIIEAIQEENYFGENFTIYHVRIFNNQALVMIPFSNAQEMGIRKPIAETSVEDIFHFMESGDVDVSMNWKGRYKENQDLMKSGSMLDMALVLKSLFYLNLIKPLSFREKKMMEKVKELIITEISEVSSMTVDQIERKILDTLSACFKEMSPQLDS